jgi:3-oxoacyl-[acyl-carrier protein] reductase
VSDTAIITGGGSGLGEAIARALHGAGYRVAVTDIDAGKAHPAPALDPRGNRHRPAAGRHRWRRDRMRHREIDKRWGGVQVLVNNAVLTRAVPVLDIALDDWDQVMAVNARGPLPPARSWPGA